MVFSELTFLYIFLPVCLILHLSLRNTAAKNIVLLAMSLLFYAWGEPIYVLLMITTSLVCWGLGLVIDRQRANPAVAVPVAAGLLIISVLFFIFKSPATPVYVPVTILVSLVCWGLGAVINKRRPAVALSVAAALLPLIFFKYSGFLAGTVGLNFKGPSLPIGISFYTFQIISYLIDVYRGDTKAQKNPAYFMMYVSLFPQLIAGPIVRYVDVEREIMGRRVNSADFSAGVVRFLTGLGKKVVLADTVGAVVNSVFGRPLNEISTLAAWGVMLCYTFQIYFDFSGYSDMAIGLGKMLGFKYNENFNHPYIATSVKDFWRRWHISMSTFFRDYIYIPMGGNRRHQLLNMFVVWAATGMWHGAGWNFILWGLYFFVLLTVEKYLMKKVKLPKVIAIPATFVLVILGWVFFYFEDLGQVFEMFKIMFGRGYGTDLMAGPQLLAILPTLVICAIGATPLPVAVKDKIFKAVPGWAQTALQVIYVAVMLVVCTALTVSGTYSAFLYFRF